MEEEEGRAWVLVEPYGSPQQYLLCSAMNAQRQQQQRQQQWRWQRQK